MGPGMSKWMMIMATALIALIVTTSTVLAHGSRPPLPPPPPPNPLSVNRQEVYPPRWSWLHWWEANRDPYLYVNRQDRWAQEDKLLQLEKGTIFKLNSDIRTSDRIVAFIEKPDAILTFPLIKIGIDKYASEMIDTYFFQDNNSCGFLIYSDTIQKYEYDFKPELILPNSNTPPKTIPLFSSYCD